MKVAWRWSWLRHGVQLAALASFLWLWRRTAAGAGDGYGAMAGAEWWFRLDPLAEGAAAIAGRTWTWLAWPALAMLAVSLVAGRGFCGWICPLGSVLGGFGRCIGWLRRRLWRGRAAPAWAPRIRFAVLAAVILAAVGGLQLAGLFDPFAILTRATANADRALRAGTDAASTAALDTAIEPASEAVYARLKPVLAPSATPLALAWVGLGLLAAVAALELLGRRGWCRWGCPLGAVYGLAARIAPLGRFPARACSGCDGCRTSCDLGAFAPDGRLRHADCTLCLACVDGCQRGIAGVRLPAHRPATSVPDPGRRAVLIAGLGAAGAATGLARLPVGPLGDRPPPDDLIRPPGVAADEAAFLARCVRCGACLGACPQDALHPDGLSAGLGGLLAPRLVARRGACAPDCTRCGEVCPTGAIPRLGIAEKARKPVGLAVVDRKRCIPWDRAESCLVCEEHCPVADKAIRLEPGPHGEAAPVVRAETCTGCGWCELVCPLEGDAGIRIRRLEAGRDVRPAD